MNLIEKVSLLKWGISKQEYKNIFSGKHRLFDHPIQNAVGFYDEIENRKVSVVAYFIVNGEQDNLVRVDISFENIKTDIQRNFIFKNLLTYLKKRYGKINYKNIATKNAPKKFRFSELNIWKTKDTIITATLALSRHGCQNTSVVISFSDNYNDPISKLWNWIDSNQYEVKSEFQPLEPLSNEQLNKIKNDDEKEKQNSIQKGISKVAKEDWKKFAIAFWIIWFLTNFEIRANSLNDIKAIIYYNFFIHIVMSILIGYYAFKLTNKKHFSLMGLFGLSQPFSLFAFFVIWKLRYDQVKKL